MSLTLTRSITKPILALVEAAGTSQKGDSMWTSPQAHMKRWTGWLRHSTE